MFSIYKELLQENNFKFVIEHNVEIPQATGHFVLIEVKACGLSLLDAKVLTELYRRHPRPRHPVGQEVAGIVVDVGSDVTSVHNGDRVTGILPVDSLYSGCANFCLLQEFDVVSIPNAVSFIEAAGSIGDGVKAYTALHYLARLCSGDVILVTRGASSFGSMAIQVAHNWGAKVIATVGKYEEEKLYLESLKSQLAQVIEVNSKSSLLVNTVMEETGGLGVDCVIDNGVQMFTLEEDVKPDDDDSGHLATKHDVITCLGVGGRWVTSQSDLQLDPPNSQLLFLKGASVCFLFEHVWTLSTAQQGRYQHILNDVLQKIKDKTLKPNIVKIINIDSALDALYNLEKQTVGKVVLQL